MEILVDREVVGGREAFSPLGTVRLFDGRALNCDELGAAEVLVCRSVTRVAPALVADSSLRFVGTTTAGTDHVDVDALADAGIAFADAAGCNAPAVAEHVICCLRAVALARSIDATALRVGIVGYGHVGKALARHLERLGIDYVVNDPPLGAAIDDAVAVPLEEVLACDVVTLHTPLTGSGAWPTRNLLNRERIAALPPNALLINAARGGIVDEAALLERLDTGPPLYVALDCWAGEPVIDAELACRVWHGSPHIAGHTLEARVRATELVLESLQDFLGLPRDAAQIALPPAVHAGTRDVDALLAAVHDLNGHTQRTRALAALPSAERAARFDADRRTHGLRRAFAAHRVAAPVARPGMATDTVATLRALGFEPGPADATIRNV